MERKTDQVEKLIESAKQAFPDDSMILAEESKFFEYINNHPKALNALEQAFFNNKGNPYIAVRLARLYENENRSEDAIRVLTECVDTKPGDRYANFNLATLLMKYNPEKKADIKIFLRRAFTDGDKNYLAQFWFARTLYIEDPRGDAKKYFSALNDIRMDPNEKNEVRGIVMENRISVKFTGSILKKELSLGFISRDGYRDQIFAHQNDTEEHVWEELREGNRVTFELGFSYRGPKAISITKETLFDLGIQNKI
jgi:cold shock CspA family protein